MDEEYTESDISKEVKRLMDEEGFEFGEAVKEAMKKGYAYGGGVGNLFEPTPTYHQYHDMTAPITYGTLMDQRRGYAIGDLVEEQETFGLQNLIGSALPEYTQTAELTDMQKKMLEGPQKNLKEIMGLSNEEILKNISPFNDKSSPATVEDINNFYAKKSLDKAPWNQDNQTMTSGVVDSITNSNMVLPERKPRGSIYDDAAVFEELVSGSDIPQDMYSQSNVNQFKDPIRDMEAGITWSEEDKAAYPELYEDFKSGYTTNLDQVPGMGTKAIHFKDAPVDFMKRANDPTKGPLDAWRYRALRAGDPVATAKWMEKQGMELPENLQGIDTRNILDKTKDGITSLDGKIKKGGQMVFSPLMALANTRNPLNPNAVNYNPALQGQVDFLKEQGGYGVIDQSGLSKITGGRLAGKNLVSGFGTNDIFGMYEKDLEKLEKNLEKLPDRWSKLKKNNPSAYKQKYDNMVAKINQNKNEQQWLKDNNIKSGPPANWKKWKTEQPVAPWDRKDRSPSPKGSWGGHGSAKAYDKSQQPTYDRIREVHGSSKPSKSSKSSKSSSSSSGGWGPWAKDGGIINIIR